MIFIASAWSPNMVVDDHCLLDFYQIDRATFKKLCPYAHSCMNKENLAKILRIKFNPEHVQLRAGDCLMVVHIKYGKLQPDAEELPRNVRLEYYCYNVYSPSTHVIVEKEFMEDK